MLTRQELADLLMTVRVRDVAEKAGVSEKTIYRLRHQVNEPSLTTLRKLLQAVKDLKRRKS